MKSRTMLRCLVIAITVGPVVPVLAQWTGRVEALRSQTVFQFKRVELFYGLGMDHVTSERTSLGFDITGAWSALLSGAEGIEGAEEIDYKGSTIHYDLRRAAVGFTYHSEFAFSDNGYGHVYLGPTVGVMWAKVTAKISYIDSPSYYVNEPGDLGLKESSRDSGVFTPLGLRIGCRGGMDGGYGDLYFGVGMNLGKDGLEPAAFLPKGVAIAPLFIQFGLAFGFGG